VERNPPADCIAAVATAPGRGGVGIVRLSGPGLAPFATRLTGGLPEPRRATRARFLDEDGAEIDEGLVLFFPAPHSYTGEDVLELQGHGGPVVLHLLLQRCLALGARLAEPGEFTQRAFLNDKLDLAQAEAVADLIEASTAGAARAAVRSLSGEFSAVVRGLAERLVRLRMLVEAGLDFPEEELDLATQPDIGESLGALVRDVAALGEKARLGSFLRSGLRVVLAGQTNVGKSSLLNRLAGEERAIVSAVAGTTRDALRETIQVRGIPLHIVDTAGLRETTDEVERLGIQRTWREIEGADVVLFLLDARQGLTAADRDIAARLPQAVERIDIFNKIDLTGAAAGRTDTDGHVALALSAKRGDGIDLLEGELLRVAGWGGGVEDVFLGRERHLQALAVAAGYLTAAGAPGVALELRAEDLRLAHQALARITGEFTADDLLGEIFSRFCIGK